MTTKDGEEWVFTKSIKLRNGRRIFAARYGLQAFRIRVRRKTRD